MTPERLFSKEKPAKEGKKHGLRCAAVTNHRQQVVYLATSLYCIVLLMFLVLKVMLFYIYTVLCLNY